MQLACWHTHFFRWGGVWPWWLSSFRRRRHCWCAHMSPLANFECSHRVTLAPCCVICILHLIALCILETNWLPEWSLLSSAQCYCQQFSPCISSGNMQDVQMLPKNALLSFCRNTKPELAVHVLCAGHMAQYQLILSCSPLARTYIARTYDVKNFWSSIQVFWCKTFTLL